MGSALVTGDPDYLRQLLLILLDNALKYTPPDGTVTLGQWRRDSAVEVTVHDTGVGIRARPISRTSSSASTEPTRRGRETRAARAWVSLLPGGLLNNMEAS